MFSHGSLSHISLDLSRKIISCGILKFMELSRCLTTTRRLSGRHFLCKAGTDLTLTSNRKGVRSFEETLGLCRPYRNHYVRGVHGGLPAYLLGPWIP